MPGNEHVRKVPAEMDAVRIARELYGISVSASALPGEIDNNFYLKDERGKEFVLKLACTAVQEGVLELQNAILEYLAEHEPSLILPRVVCTSSGASVDEVRVADGETRLVRLLTYVAGKPLARVRPHTPRLLHSLGEMLGKVDRALEDFGHPAAKRELKWDLSQAGWTRDYVGHVARSDRRAMVEGFLSEFEEDVVPALPRLRSSVIHNDANDYNVLVGQGSDDMQVVSIIDFGDMVHTSTICDLAIATAYVMLGKPDPLTAAAHVVAGYHEIFPLTEEELTVLYPLIRTRLCVSVVNSAYQQKVEPRNEYLTISEKPAWELLERLAHVHPRLAHYIFRDACGLPACPSGVAVEHWIEEHSHEFGRVLEPDPNRAGAVVLDLSIGSTELGNPDELGDAQALTQRIFGKMAGAGAAVGVGRYNEARMIYTSEEFREQGNDGPEWRTVHMGLDLFAEAGARVFAPFDSVVHGFKDNAAPLDYGPTIILRHTVDEGGLTFFTLYGHLSTDSLEGLYEGMPVERGTPIGKAGRISENGGWPPHLHFQVIVDLLDKGGDFPGVARPDQRGVWSSLCPDPNLILRIPAEKFPSQDLSPERILDLRSRYLGKSLSASYSRPLKIERASMQYMYDADGRRYLDARNNVPHVGHCHPRVVRAGQEQMAVLSTNTRYLHETIMRYAERLVSTLPDPLSVCFFVNSGSEANELALRMARSHTGRKDMVVTDVGYHGNTTTLSEISPYKFDGPGGEGALPYVHKVPIPDVYRGEHKRDDSHAAEKYARHVGEAVRQADDRGGVCAFMHESLPGVAGHIVLPDGYLGEAYKHTRDAGGVCIADEVQVGLGRVGTHFWAFETQGVVPDIVTMGKPMGNGHPLGAVVTTPEIADSFANGMEYFNTFGGNPVSCAIGLAVLEAIAEESLQENALRVGGHMMEGSYDLKNKHPLIGDVRGLGLYVGLELVKDRETLAPATSQAAYVANRMKERGVLLSPDGKFENVLIIKPPMVFDKANADLLIATLDEVLSEDPVRDV